MGNSWTFIDKNRDILNTKHFQNSIVYYLLFLFFSNSEIFFSILPVYSFQKKFKIFVLFYCMDPRFYQKILQNYDFFIKKNWDIRNQKFQQNSTVSISFLFVNICDIFYSISPIQTCPKIMKIFVVFLFDGFEILPTISRKF